MQFCDKKKAETTVVHDEITYKSLGFFYQFKFDWQNLRLNGDTVLLTRDNKFDTVHFKN